MKLTIDADPPFEFECEDTIASAWVSKGILEDQTYPVLPFVDDVRIVVDAGGNCGATAVHFARHYPEAEIHTIEPGSLQRSILERNAAAYPNITIHPIALADDDGELPIYQGAEDSGMTSLTPSEWTADDHEMVSVRHAGRWAADTGLARIDILKLDVEGFEAAVLASLTALLPTIKVLYVEYDSRDDRRRIDHTLEATHDLYAGKVFLDQGEVVYLAKAIADDPAATNHLRSLFDPGQRA
ncbi:MAG: FkbM family methyltransferase [Acidimicrobiales bacterium]|nr:FkbM family methyltransferase [Acidimicrobiales bacterium]